MSKYSTIEVWNRVFGNKTEVYDYAGRLPHLQTNDTRYKVIRVRGTRNSYDIYEDE